MQCHLYLLQATPFWYSHDEVLLFFKTALNHVLNQDIDVILTENSPGSAYSGVSFIHDYVYRGAELEDCSLYYYMKWYKKKYGKSKDGISFTTDHLHHTSHFNVRCAVEQVVAVMGKRLPNIDDPDITEANALYFRQMVLLLFKRFRSSLGIYLCQ
jgi:hypothetical protein